MYKSRIVLQGYLMNNALPRQLHQVSLGKVTLATYGQHSAPVL